MPAKDLGTKHTCFKCGTRFYDLKKPEPLCPKCGADQRQSPASKPSSERRRAPAKAVPPPKVDDAEAEVELEEELEADEEVEEPEESEEP